MGRLETLYKAASRLGDKTPASLQNLKSKMLQAVQGEADVRAKAVADYERRIVSIFHAGQKCAADPQSRALALADLTGIFLFNKVEKSANTLDRIVVTTTVINRTIF